MRLLVVLRGIPASGKSTFIKEHDLEVILQKKEQVLKEKLTEAITIAREIEMTDEELHVILNLTRNLCVILIHVRSRHPSSDSRLLLLLPDCSHRRLYA